MAEADPEPPPEEAAQVHTGEYDTGVNQPWTAASLLGRVQRRWKEGALSCSHDRPEGPPEYADNVPFYMYRPGEWKRTLFTDPPRGILHSITPVHWQGRASN